MAVDAVVTVIRKMEIIVMGVSGVMVMVEMVL